MPHTKPLLSRVADAVYWLGRYIERAENVARFLDVNHNLMLDLPAGLRRPVAAHRGHHRRPRASSWNATAPPRRTTWCASWPSIPRIPTRFIPACWPPARTRARVRETISSEMWQQINSLYLLITGGEPQDRAHGSCPTSATRCAWAATCSTASLHVTMSHNEAWQFIRLGTMLERADKTTRILDVKYFILLPSVSDVGTPYDDVQWSAVLKSVSGFEMYRKRYGRISPDRIVEFLLLDGEFPRAVPLLHRARRPRAALHHRHARRHFLLPQRAAHGRAAQRTGFRRRWKPSWPPGCTNFATRVQTKMNTIDECISGDFFAQRPLSCRGAGRERIDA